MDQTPNSCLSGDHSTDCTLAHTAGDPSAVGSFARSTSYSSGSHSDLVIGAGSKRVSLWDCRGDRD